MRTDGVLCSQPPGRVFGSLVRISSERPDSLPVRILRGRDAVLAMQPALVALSRRTGQHGAVDWLDHFIISPDSIKKTPYLLLVSPSALRGEPAAYDSDLVGAVFLYEYRVAHLGTRIFATDDIFGTRTVVAPPELRFQVANLAVRELMREHAAMVFVSMDGRLPSAHNPAHTSSDGVRIALRTRSVPAYLPLGPTLDATLAALGPRTRRNLRCYRRRAVAELGVQFVTRAQPTLNEFLELNRGATHPLSDEAAAWRHRLSDRSISDPATLCCGLRASDGRWVSLLWGHRHQGTTHVLWQINLAGVPRQSLTTAMRAFLLEQEIALGTRQIHFVGGTPHSMRSCFLQTDVTDLLAVRAGSMRARALHRFAGQLLPDANFLRGALQDRRMVWMNEAA